MFQNRGLKQRTGLLPVSAGS